MNDVFASARGREPIRLADIADFSLGELRVRPSLREVERDGSKDQLEPRVMQVLVALAASQGAVVSRDDLIARCWEGRIVGEAAINRCISILRDLAETNRAFVIETIPRVGYRLVSAHPSVPAVDAEPVADKEESNTPSPAATASTPRLRTKPPLIWIAAAVGVIVLAVGIFAVRHHPASRAASSAGPVQASIAVLPFKNLSSDKDAGYLADGVQDEILTRLAKIGSLKVISRTSTEEFATHPKNLRDIARKLGVANVLEGNVQKSGNRIRINVQLIRAANDSHLWAEDYDRKLDDMFSVESDVAGMIAQVLAAKVTPPEHAEIVAKPTDNPRAYDLYLRALVFADKNDHTSLQTATELLTEATRLDPKFALAWAWLARNEAYRHFGDDLAAVRKGTAHAALAKALALQPDLAETQVAKGFYLYYGEMNYPAAERELRLVNARWPNNAKAMEALALILRRLGKWKESTGVLERLVRLDPLSEHHRVLLGGGLAFEHDFASSLAVFDGALQIWPDDQLLMAQKAGVLLQLGQLGAAGEILKNVHPGPDDNAIGVIGYHFWLTRQFAKGVAFFRSLLAIEQQGENRDSVTCTLRLVIAEYLRKAGDAAGARENYSAALVSIQNELKKRPDDTSFLGLLPTVYAGLGQYAKAVGIARSNIDRLRTSHDALDLGDAEGTALQLTVRFGSRTDAIAGIARQMNTPGAGITPAILRLDPDFDRLRGDPRFEALAHGKDPVQAN